MKKHTEKVGYKKVLQSVGAALVIFIILSWILTKTEEHDKQIKSQAALSISNKNTSPVPVKNEEAEVVVYNYTPTALQSEFDTNEVRITHKLEGNVLALQGEISDIGLSLGRPVISISIPNSYQVIKVFFDSTLMGKISELNIGDNVRVSSRDVSLNPFGTIHLRDASLLPIID
jgi:hypothetical protein